MNPVVENLRKLMLAEDRWRTVDELARALRKQFGLPCMANDVREWLRELSNAEFGYLDQRLRAQPRLVMEFRLLPRVKEEKK